MVMAEGTAVLRRNRPGTKAQDFYNWPDESFDEMDSTLAVQQYIQQNIRADCSNIDKILEPPEGQDEGVWKYEHLRQFCLELNGLAVKLQSECHPDTCTQMTATEQWIFLCAAHKTPKECPAIDYTRHTLDGAACLLNSNKYFPSRVSIKESSVAKLGSVCRRIYRIFSHAYFHHRQIFDEYEADVVMICPCLIIYDSSRMCSGKPESAPREELKSKRKENCMKKTKHETIASPSAVYKYATPALTAT
ncbi:MOB-like protein phocein isoform 2-T2 [Hipposideros larvatus]